MSRKATAALAAILLAAGVSTGRAADRQAALKSVVDAAVRPVMGQYDIPGMAVGIIAAGKPTVFNYGIASRETRQPVTRDTLFEIGSISKTFTVTAASYAQVTGRLSWTDKAGKYLPALNDTPFGDVRLLDLATHTPGGFPLQLPDDVQNNDDLMRYLAKWKPKYEAGTMRTYANPSIGMLGVITAKAMEQDFAALMEGRIFPALGLKNTYINVPRSKMGDYAQGYTRQDAPARLTDAVLSGEAYGVRTTAADMARFLDANLGLGKLEPKVRAAAMATHTGYYRAGAMTQDLIWEQYAYPTALKTLLAGNSSAMALNPTPVEAITPPLPPRDDAWINKTGSTNGFGAYVAFVPNRRLGVVILANKNYPNEARVTLAHQILTQLAREPAPKEE